MKNLSAPLLPLFLLWAFVHIAASGTSLEASPLCAASKPHPIDTLRHYVLRETAITSNSAKSGDVNPIQMLKVDDLQNVGTVSVATALRNFSGVEMKDYGGLGGLKTVNVRSLGTQHIGVFYDGVELGNAQNGQVDLGRFSLDNLETLSLANADEGSLLLSAKEYASAATIYMQSRRPEFADSSHYHLVFSAEGGSFCTLRPSLLWEQRLSKNLSLSLQADYLHCAGDYEFRYHRAGGYDTTAVRKNSDIQAFHAEVGLFGKIPQGSWQAKVYVYNSERGLPSSVVRGRFWQDDRQSDNNAFLQASLQKHFKVYSLQVKMKYANDYLHYRSIPSQAGSSMPADNRFKQNELYLSSAHRFTLNEHYALSASADYQFNQSSSDVMNYARPQRHAALFAAAARVSYASFSAKASLLSSFISDHAEGKLPLHKKHFELTPTISLSAHPFRDKSIVFRAFYKRIFRMPTLNELYYRIVGNTKLSPERADQWDVGIDYTPKPFRHSLLSSFALKLDAYYNKVENKIVATPTSNQFRWTMQNLGEVRIIGLDASMQTSWHFGELDWGVKGSYTFQHATDVTSRKDSFYGEQIAYTPRHSGSASLTATWRGWMLRYDLLCTGKRYMAKNNVRQNRLPRWTTSDIYLHKTFSRRQNNFTLSVEVNNFLNHHYEVVACYPMPGINGLLGIKMEL